MAPAVAASPPSVRAIIPPTLPPSFHPRMKLRILLVAALLAAGCSSDPDRLPPKNPFKPEQRSAREVRLAAGQLYKAARQALDSSDYSTAIERYDLLGTRYPFSEYATQAQLEKVYAQYRSYDRDSALAGADRFLREHPRHASADYVQYLKGLINFDRDEGLSDLIGLDGTTRDMSSARRSFDDFGLLVQRYPSSAYAADARLRMIHLRNLVAQSELHAVRFYMKRGAYVAAAKRGEQIIAQYPGAPATLEALESIERSYRAMGLTAQADEAARLLAANRAGAAAPAAATPAPQSAVEPPAKPSGWSVEMGGSEIYRSGETTTPPPASDAPAAPAAAAPAAGETRKPGWIIELGDEQVVGPEADAKAETSPTSTPPAPAPAP
jgi:outer membrane protein assembly factor BamD